MSRSPGTIVAIYALTSAVWIAFSDSAADALFSSLPSMHLLVQTLKGWLFVLITSAILYISLTKLEKIRATQDSALQESESILRGITQSAQDAIIMVDSLGRVTFWNPAAERMLGYSADEILGKHLHDTLAPEQYHEGHRAAFDGFRSTGEGILLGKTIELHARRKDGKEIAISLSLSSLNIRDEWHAVGILRDVTEKEQAELAILENEKKFRSLYQSMIEGVAIHEVLRDQQGRIVDYRILDVNPQFEWYTGIAPDRAAGELASRLYGTEHPPYLDIYARIVDGGYPVRFETYFPPLDRHYAISAFSHGVDQFVTVFYDITERKRLELRLADQLAFQQALIDTIPYAVFYKGADTRFLGFNKAYEECFGVRRQDLIGKRVLDLEYLPEADRIAYQAEDEATIAAVGRLQKEMPIPFADGVVHQTLYSVNGFRQSDGSPGGLIGVIVDITERKRLQEMMIQTEKMMSLGGLAAGMAHEINNPLAGILQSLQVVERRLSDDTGVNLRTAAETGCPLSAIRAFLDRRGITGLLKNIRESGVRAARIVSNMLEFSRKQESSKASAHLSELLDRAVELCAQDYDLSKKYDFRKILIVRDYDQSVPPIPCTATQIEQVFMNILRNAAQAMGSRTGEGPPPRITLRTRLDHGSARIEVEDNGPGMDETSLRKIFEPFFTTKPVGEGTGLGLSVSYFIIVSNHDGRIEVRSELGKGSCFIIHLPLQGDG